MRIDKYLKVSRVVKRRTVANEVCSAGRVLINDKVVKPGAEVKVGDIVTIRFGNGETRFRVLAIRETVRKEEAGEMYELLEGTEVE
ncbi:MAG: RNA-binding S4 domain-containing protein [Clostridiales bacterium]|nr:RNA-binding S4 domain-containing protein [Clostridiales bacterium]MBR4797738.1 RNA-binding S4 domain-containing protein [Oscillospiraceae bacterium]MBR5974963.1 RNA-binding S4 domain-containing protein [Clostridiales bacterium]